MALSLFPKGVRNAQESATTTVCRNQSASDRESKATSNGTSDQVIYFLFWGLNLETSLSCMLSVALVLTQPCFKNTHQQVIPRVL